ncbi:hypothetical protein [Ekhidna sp.]|uniref:hypothetical protein n=1 Tax=Ekhidna sp. TaxID=2608089 RepID=UPI00329801B0
MKFDYIYRLTKESAKNVSVAYSNSPSIQKKKSRAAPSITSDVVQRVIRSSPPGLGQHFIRQGRSGRHNSAANRRALRAIVLDRNANPNPVARHVNNQYETIMAGGGAPPVHIAHHISDENVQETVVHAANNAPGAWQPVIRMVAGINPAAAPVPLPPQFAAAANAAFAQANMRLAILTGIAGPLPHNAVINRHLTALASAIANSPMNLHYGLGQTNMSISQHGDPNSFNAAIPPTPLTRRLSWRSTQMVNQVGFPAMNYRTHAMAAVMPPVTVAAAQAATYVPPGPVPFPVVHASGSPVFFTGLQ